MSFDLKGYLQDRRRQVEEFIASHFKRHTNTGTLHKSMVYSLAAGGKRVRPILAIAAYEAIAGNSKSCKPVLPFAAALECIHTYSLIHDDLPCMDDDDLRRGKPTNHKVFGDATAVLAGDALLTEAFALCSDRNTDLPATVQLAIIDRLADAAGAQGMVGGQLYDMEHESKQPTIESLKRIHTNKTGRLLTVAVEIGALTAGVSEGELQPFTDFGFHLGYGFQIYDDVLDVTGGDEIGKSQKSDIKRGKATFVSLLGVDESRARAESEIKQAVAAISHLGQAAQPLIEIAHYITTRKN